MEPICAFLRVFVALTVIPMVNASPFLDVYLRVEPLDDFCGARDCNISYAISVLQSPNHFDLQSTMLQEGTMPRTDDRTFEDNTVVRLSRSSVEADNVYLGLSLFDVPEDMQKYIIIDVTDVVEKGRKSKMEFNTDTVRCTVLVYKRSEAMFYNDLSDQMEAEARRLMWNSKMAEQQQQHEPALSEAGCSCQSRQCSCCRRVSVRKVHLDDVVCTNITYVPEDLGVKVALSVDKHVYYSKEISVTESLPICFEVPHLREYASLCVRLFNFEAHRAFVATCAEVEARLYHVKVARKKLGCMRIPL